MSDLYGNYQLFITCFNFQNSLICATYINFDHYVNNSINCQLDFSSLYNIARSLQWAKYAIPFKLTQSLMKTTYTKSSKSHNTKELSSTSLSHRILSLILLSPWTKNNLNVKFKKAIPTILSTLSSLKSISKPK
jgi:hypothetical protein